MDVYTQVPGSDQNLLKEMSRLIVLDCVETLTEYFVICVGALRFINRVESG